MSGEHTIVTLCAALGVTPAGYHAWQRAEPGRRERADAELADQIASVHREHRGRYGAPRIQRELSERLQRHSRKCIGRLMRERGLGGRVARRWVPGTTDSNHSEPIAPNRLAARPAPCARDQVWVSDLTCVPTDEGWLYAAVVLDRWSRRVVGWACADNLGAADTALGALRMALHHRRPLRGLLHLPAPSGFASTLRCCPAGNRRSLLAISLRSVQRPRRPVYLRRPSRHAVKRAEFEESNEIGGHDSPLD